MPRASGAAPRRSHDRSLACSRKHDDDRAIADFDQAIAPNPKYDYAFTARGIACQQQGCTSCDFSKAIRRFMRDFQAF
jgi:hypothetical protein